VKKLSPPLVVHSLLYFNKFSYNAKLQTVYKDSLEYDFDLV